MATHGDEKRSDYIMFKVTPTLKKQAKLQAQKEGRSLSNYLEQLIIRDAKEKDDN